MGCKDGCPSRDQISRYSDVMSRDLDLVVVLLQDDHEGMLWSWVYWVCKYTYYVLNFYKLFNYNINLADVKDVAATRNMMFRGT